MAAYTWILPSPPASGASSGTPSVIGPTGGGALAFGALDLVFDPISRDLIDAADGSFVESSDSRTSVLFQMESTYLAWWGDPFSGSRVRALLAGDEPGTEDDLRDECLRCLQQLVAENVISDLTVSLDRDEHGRTVVLLAYTDRTSGRPVDLAFVPIGG